MIIQKIGKQYGSALEKAIVYYDMLLSLNGIKLRNRELQLLAFTAVRGTITPLSAREEFVRIFDSSLHSVENMKGVLVRKGLIIKDGDMYRVLPAITLDFNEPLGLIITLDGKTEQHDTDGVPNQEDSTQVGD